MIVIIDYDTGNIGSIHNMLKRCGIASLISQHPDEILKADKLILPGVGSFDAGIKKLQERNLIPLLQKKVCDETTPILGICLGMQLMCASSEEGTLPGLNWLTDAKVKKFHFPDKNIKVPHMGWNYVQIKNNASLFRSFLSSPPRFYFVHSYYVECKNDSYIAAQTTYGGFSFTSAFQKEHIFGVQFHPEKSHVFGMEILKNFASL